MANERVIFRRGTSTTLPSEKVPGTIYITTDTGEMYVDDTESSRIQIKDDTKMDKENPTGTGSFSLNRKADTTIGNYSFAEGNNTTASGSSSHAEGHLTTASGLSSHAEGHYTTASGNWSHAEGQNTTASKDYAHAEGSGTTASGYDSHAEGFRTAASGDDSHAEGQSTKASSEDQHAQGKYNIEDSTGTYADIIGNGTSDTARSNAATVDWNGNAWYAGDVYVGSTSGTNKDDGSKKLATEEYVQSMISSGGVAVDVAMSDTSVHPVQNKVIKTYVDSLIIDDGSID